MCDECLPLVASRRFCPEFLAPSAPVVGPLELFHLICPGLMADAIPMLRPGERGMGQAPVPGKSEP